MNLASLKRASLFQSIQVLGLLALVAVVWHLPRGAAAKGDPLWVRIELVENTNDGSAFNRCEIEGTLKTHDARSWRVFYGEVRGDAGAGWEPIRPQSGCGLLASNRAPNPWTLRGSPYLLADITLEPGRAFESGASLQAILTIRKLTGFETPNNPKYDERTDTRMLHVPLRSSSVIPIFIASLQETEAFGVRELLLRFRVAGLRPSVGYGEVAVIADVPRARILLDGGFVGRTSSDGPFVLAGVRTGNREIVIVDPSGREARTVARVKKGGRANVSLTLLPKSATSGSAGLRRLGRNPQGSEEFWRDKDGAVMVQVPGLEFRMGSAEGEGESNEHPSHQVRVNDFLMDKTEVTWGQYKRFLAVSGHPPPESPVWGMREALPASGITWGEAAAFCAWAGGRLPTEAEWERAARGNETRKYPWGNKFDPWRCNTRDGGPHAPNAAGEYPDCVSSLGILDLAGSVSEWCSDWFEDEYYTKSPVENPMGPKNGTTRVSRGGGWMSPAQYTRVVARLGVDPSWRGPMQGFRCVQDDRTADEK